MQSMTQLRYLLVLSDAIRSEEDMFAYAPFGDLSIPELINQARARLSPGGADESGSISENGQLDIYPYYFGNCKDHFGKAAREILRDKTLACLIDSNVFDVSRYGYDATDAATMLGLFGEQAGRTKSRYIIRNEAAGQYWDLIPPAKLAVESNSDIITALAAEFLHDDEQFVLNLIG